MGLGQSKARTAVATSIPSSTNGWSSWGEEDKKLFLDAMTKNEDFQKVVAQKLKEDSGFKDTFLSAIAKDPDFRTKVIEQMISGDFKKAVSDAIKEDPDFIALVKGAKGETGDRGEKGDRGEIGPQGIPGVIGPKGEKGERGEIGPIGPKGDAGGPIGPKGDRGERGETGAQGIPGIKGDRGEIGPRGIQGIPGIIGPKGDRGEIGPAGVIPNQIQFQEFNNIFAPDGGNYTLFGLGHKPDAPRAVIFKNGPGRQADGGPNTMTIRNDGGAVRIGAVGESRIYTEAGAVDIGATLPGRTDLPGINIYNKQRKDWSHLGANQDTNEGITNFFRGNTRTDGEFQIAQNGHRWNIGVKPNGDLFFNKAGRGSVVFHQTDGEKVLMWRDP